MDCGYIVKDVRHSSLTSFRVPVPQRVPLIGTIASISSRYTDWIIASNARICIDSPLGFCKSFLAQSVNVLTSFVYQSSYSVRARFFWIERAEWFRNVNCDSFGESSLWRRKFSLTKKRKRSQLLPFFFLSFSHQKWYVICVRFIPKRMSKKNCLSLIWELHAERWVCLLWLNMNIPRVVAAYKRPYVWRQCVVCALCTVCVEWKYFRKSATDSSTRQIE